MDDGILQIEGAAVAADIGKAVDGVGQAQQGIAEVPVQALMGGKSGSRSDGPGSLSKRGASKAGP